MFLFLLPISTYWFTFLTLAYLGSPGQRATMRHREGKVCVTSPSAGPAACTILCHISATDKSRQFEIFQQWFPLGTVYSTLAAPRYLDHLVANRMAPCMCLDPCGTRSGSWFQPILYHISATYFLVYAVRIFFFIKMSHKTDMPNQL